MAAKTKNLIMVLSRNIIVKKAKNNYETIGNELYLILGMCSSLQGTLLLKLGMEIIEVAFHFLKSHTTYVFEMRFAFFSNIFQGIASVNYAFKDLISK